MKYTIPQTVVPEDSTTAASSNLGHEPGARVEMRRVFADATEALRGREIRKSGVGDNLLCMVSYEKEFQKNGFVSFSTNVGEKLAWMLSNMPTLAPSSLEKITRCPPPQTWNGRGYAWSAVIIASRLPEIICHDFGFNAEVWISPLSQTIILFGLAILAAKLCPIKNLPGFILAIAALTLGWRVVVPWIETSTVFHSASHNLSWGGRFFLLRAIRTTGAAFMIVTLIGSGIGRRELFLKLGNWHAPVQPEPFLRFRRPIPWTRFAVTLLLIFGVLLSVYLYLTLHPQIEDVHRLLLVLPWAVATSALNAANEEFQFRNVLLARLRNIVPPKEAFLLTAVLFGVGHYFGQPSGWGGVFMAGIAGWIWAKSMIETRGFVCAFASHFVQDIIIFGFLAMSATDLSSAWS
jgi:membrane protease YdiL (CAAX protease family)